MNIKITNDMTSRQLMNFLLSSQICVKLFQSPGVLAQKSGHDGWISAIIVGIFSYIVTISIILLLKKYKNFSIYDVNKYLYGKYMGFFFNSIIFLYLWAIACINLRLLLETLKINYLRFTPGIVLTFFIMIPTFYLSFYGLKAIARFSSIIWLFMIVTLLLLFFSLKSCDIKLLMPIGESGISGIKNGLGECFYAYLGFELIAIIYPFITDKKNIIKYSLISTTLNILFFLIIILICTSFFGENQLKKIIFPMIRLTKTYDIYILQRFDLFWVSLWIPVMITSVSAYFSPAYYTLQKLYKVKYGLLSLSIFTIMTILISIIPKNPYEVYKYIPFLTVFQLIFCVFIIICYFFSFIKNTGVKTNE